MKNWLFLSILLVGVLALGQDISIKDTATKKGVPFATISFGDGKGTFADDDGVFRFSRKLYKDVDSLHISSIGYQDLSVAASSLGSEILLSQEADELEAVMLSAELNGKFKNKKQKPVAHDNYFNCWLPTVESEIAVRFDRIDHQPTRISQLQFPIVKEESQVSKKGKLRAFSTMIRVMFYDVENGKPAYRSFYPSMTYVITEKSDDVIELDIDHLNINIPKNGIFAAIQILGYTTPDGKLIKAKKYREIETVRGLRKVSTTYRPLLPFTDEIEGKQTWVRRIFYNNKEWVLFDLEYNPNSSLVRSGHDNYGIGAEFKVFYKKD
ncbi:MAG: carboxypeptidase-like regulatory domain-containing protein [Nonlabens sp.]|uniref:carboxypeptidase-like regulatory domain-containing protein n=1 Tax=Nonlabens sp. TaxID=1888209 RepID=UPI003EF25932